MGPRTRFPPGKLDLLCGSMALVRFLSITTVEDNGILKRFRGNLVTFTGDTLKFDCCDSFNGSNCGEEDNSCNAMLRVDFDGGAKEV